MEENQFTYNYYSNNQFQDNNLIKRSKILKNNRININNNNDNNKELNKINNLKENELFLQIFEFIRDCFSSKESYHEDGLKIKMINERKICIKLHYLDNYFVFLNSRNLVLMQKELNEEESTEEYKKFNLPHKIGNINELEKVLFKNVEEKINFLYDLNRRSFYMKTFEYRINNFFNIFDKNIKSQHLIFDEEPSLELSLPNTDIYFTLDDKDMLEIDFKDNVSNEYRKILINDKKISFNDFGKINKGFQRIAHFIMMYVYNIHIYNNGRKIITYLQNHFGEDFKIIEDNFTESFIPYFQKTFRIKNVQYILSIEENGEVRLMRDSYLYSTNNSFDLYYVEKMRLNKKIGFLLSDDLIKNQNTDFETYEYGFKNVLVSIAKIIIEFIRNNE